MDLKTKKSVKIYDFSTDPDTGLMYAWQFFNPVMIGDNIYFDDIVGKDKNEFYDIRMYSYSIADKKIKALDKDAKCPMEFQGDAAWLKRSNDKKNSLFYSAKQEKLLFKTETRLGTVFTSSGDIIVANDQMSEALYDHVSTKSDSQTEFTDSVDDPRVSSYGIKLYKNGQIDPVFICGKGNVTNAVTNGDLVGWYGLSVGKPLFYSLKKDALIEVDFIDVDDAEVLGYMMRLSDNFAVLGCSTNDGVSYDYLFSLE